MATKTAKTAKTNAGQNFRCTECGWTAVKWVGRCGECQAWGTLDEIGTVVVRTTAATTVVNPAQLISEVDASQAAHNLTGVPELDRVLGGGMVPGAVILLAGNPASENPRCCWTWRQSLPATNMGGNRKKSCT